MHCPIRLIHPMAHHQNLASSLKFASSYATKYKSAFPRTMSGFQNFDDSIPEGDLYDPYAPQYPPPYGYPTTAGPTWSTPPTVNNISRIHINNYMHGHQAQLPQTSSFSSQWTYPATNFTQAQDAGSFALQPQSSQFHGIPEYPQYYSPESQMYQHTSAYGDIHYPASNTSASPSYLSPSASPATSLSLSPPSRSASAQDYQEFKPDPGHAQPSLTQALITNKPLYTHKEQLQFFRDALALPAVTFTGPFVPQSMYKPHTNSDRRRYVEEVELEAPIYFWVDDPSECGIPLSDALHSRVKRLINRDEAVFEGRGPSVSIRLEWPGYRQWSRQIPTKDFRSPPGPITRAKLAKNVAKCVQRFIAERQNHIQEEDADPRWRIGHLPHHVKLEDLVLVSIHHVSMGSWQPQLRLLRPFPA